MRNIFFAALFALSACTANAALTSIEVISTTGGDVPAGHVANDIIIGFEGQLFGQQMIVDLSSGAINQDAFGSNLAPTDALLVPFPALAYDTFVSMGGLTADTSASTLFVGGSTELPGSTGTEKFDTEGIDAAWAPSPGVVVSDQQGFLTARVVLTDDANGAAFYFGNAGGQGVSFEGGKVENGVLSFIPEPSTALLAGLALVGFVARRK
ncbi:hypothetical protein MalM25_31810 [Planctomycetes bacterium MalM25]|nr:hypothetical protein MalM25_31810 [Planctomycetes bacterium MalM25]